MEGLEEVGTDWPSASPWRALETVGGEGALHRNSAAWAVWVGVLELELELEWEQAWRAGCEK